MPDIEIKRDYEVIPISITRTIYDPAKKDFVFDSDEDKALPSVRNWINRCNPVIYWYILRIDNLADSDVSQWAVELYTHHALSITEAHIDGSDRRFDMKKRERDAWSDKYVLSIPRQLGIPVVGKGTRRLYFKIDINCKEGLMHEYGISGAFIAKGMRDVEIREKVFQYSCKVGEFKQIFDQNPDEASEYAQKRLRGKYSPQAVHIFTNSFRMIYELSRYCRSDALGQAEMERRLAILLTNFEKVPDIAGGRIIPLIRSGIDKLELIDSRDTKASHLFRLCDSLVELLHIEVMGADLVVEGLLRVEEDEEAERRKREEVMAEQARLRRLREKEKRLQREEEEERERLHREEEQNQIQETEDEIEALRQKRETLKREREKLENKKQLEEQEAKRRRQIEEEREKLRRQIQEEEEHIRKMQEEQRKIEETSETCTNSIGMKFVLIPAGEFMMGSNEYNHEKPVHKVKISRPFYLGIYPVTQREWEQVMGNNPSNFKGNNLPVESISWYDAQEFIKKLNEKEGTDKYRLPSEAEWEYAARAGTTTRYSFGDDESKLGDYAWYGANSGSKTHEVGQKKSNPWGLYDMHGNVWEWVQDKWHSNYNGAPTDGSAWERDGSNRVDRGGGWSGSARSCRSAGRDFYDADYRTDSFGFRLLRAP